MDLGVLTSFQGKQIGIRSWQTGMPWIYSVQRQICPRDCCVERPDQVPGFSREQAGKLPLIYLHNMPLPSVDNSVRNRELRCRSAPGAQGYNAAACFSGAALSPGAGVFLQQRKIYEQG